MQILAVSGSLRAGSSNTLLLQTMSALAPKELRVSLFEELADLPHFNPDLDSEDALPAVAEWRKRLQEADAVVICSPEYAHGVPGVLKNALDWVVGSGEFIGKPVALLNAQPRSTHAQASLKETLTVMMANIVPEASVAISLPGNKLGEVGLASHSEISGALRASLTALTHYVEMHPAD